MLEEVSVGFSKMAVLGFKLNKMTFKVGDECGFPLSVGALRFAVLQLPSLFKSLERKMTYVS